jgi:putative phage-type endonuclease
MAELVCGSDDPRWREERRTGVTATDLPAILGLSRYDSQYSLYWRKLGILDGDQADDAPRLALGRYLEGYIAGQWEETTTGYDVLMGGLFRSSERPWQLATPDRVLSGRDGALTSVLECKSWADADKHAWDNGPPPAVRAQVLWQMDVLGVSTGHVATLWLPSGELSSYVIEHQHIGHRDEATGLMSGPGSLACKVCIDQELMRKAGFEFWERVTEGRPPSVDGSAASRAALIAQFPQVLPVQAEVSQWRWAAYAEACTEEADWKRRKAGLAAILRESIGEAGEITVGGEVVGRRVRYPVKAHMRKASMVDKITRVKAKEDDDAERA